MTMHGNKSTAPNGTDIFELPLSRIRLLTNDNLGMILSFSLLKSAKDGKEGVEGIRFTRFPTKPMAAVSPGE